MNKVARKLNRGRLDRTSTPTNKSQQHHSAEHTEGQVDAYHHREHVTHRARDRGVHQCTGLAVVTRQSAMCTIDILVAIVFVSLSTSIASSSTPYMSPSLHTPTCLHGVPGVDAVFCFSFLFGNEYSKPFLHSHFSSYSIFGTLP